MQSEYAVSLSVLSHSLACVLGIACANIANLLLARGVGPPLAGLRPVGPGAPRHRDPGKADRKYYMAMGGDTIFTSFPPSTSLDPTSPLTHPPPSCLPPSSAYISLFFLPVTTECSSFSYTSITAHSHLTPRSHASAFVPPLFFLLSFFSPYSSHSTYNPLSLYTLPCDQFTVFCPPSPSTLPRFHCRAVPINFCVFALLFFSPSRLADGLYIALCWDTRHLHLLFGGAHHILYDARPSLRYWASPCAIAGIQAFSFGLPARMGRSTIRRRPCEGAGRATRRSPLQWCKSSVVRRFAFSIVL